MKTVYFCENFKAEKIEELIPKLEGKEKVMLYFTSNGGEVRCYQILNDYFKREGKRIELVGVDSIASSAFRFFFESECAKKRLIDCSGLFHLWRNEYTINSKGKPEYESDEHSLKYLKAAHKENIDWAQASGLNKTEMKRLRAGKDVHFSPGRMEELLAFNLKKNKIAS